MGTWLESIIVKKWTRIIDAVKIKYNRWTWWDDGLLQKVRMALDVHSSMCFHCGVLSFWQRYNSDSLSSISSRSRLSSSHYNMHFRKHLRDHHHIIIHEENTYIYAHYTMHNFSCRTHVFNRYVMCNIK